ncbi:hypothetical protein K491DRAFT_698853 [Lophiostoma macrostomum CBS 122681]|uniref:Uncharacterized protein n=1 Tax=Lophiostoma macrostomum CBS 122681 TaxID=1314788 RepID=A0A6A6SQ40_9PLEO|nr:hypothetical protein K491DRAFT_698853 [Lophiostoma macrostomum CBS 122681]
MRQKCLPLSQATRARSRDRQAPCSANKHDWSLRRKSCAPPATTFTVDARSRHVWRAVYGRRLPFAGAAVLLARTHSNGFTTRIPACGVRLQDTAVQCQRVVTGLATGRAWTTAPPPMPAALQNPASDGLWAMAMHHGCHYASRCRFHASS